MTNTKDSRNNRLAFAGISALTVLTWYALPDAVRSRGARAVIKVGLLGVTAAGVAMIPQVYPEAERITREPRLDLPPAAMTALAIGVPAIAVVGTIWGEKAIYARGERIRASGTRCAHTPAAVAFAVATGAAALVDWSKLASKITKS